MAATSASHRERRPLAGRFGVRQAVAALIAVQALALWLLGRTSYWKTDDWIYFADMHGRGRWSNDWLFSIWWKHIAPLHRAMFSVLDVGTPGTYTAALLFEIALVAVAAFAFYGILEILFGRSWWLLIPVALFGFSFQFALPLVWPSSGFQAMPETAASILCTYFWLRHLRGDGLGWLIGAAVVLGIGLCFYIRPILLLPILVALRLLFLEPSLRPGAMLRALWREKVTWAVLAVPVVIFLGVYLHRHAFGQRQPLDFNDLQHYVREAWFRNVFPGLLGVREKAGTLSAPFLAAEIGAQLVLIALVALSVFRKGVDALRGWAFLLVVVGLTFALTATGKLAESGVSIGLETRYTTNLTWLVPLAITMALQPRRVARLGAAWPSAAEAGLRPLPHWAPRAGTLVAGAGTVVACVFALFSANHIIDEWGARDGRTWTLNAYNSAKRLTQAGRTIHVPDARVPTNVVDNAFVGESWARGVLNQMGLPVVVGPPYDAVQLGDGTIVAAALRPGATLDLRTPAALAGATNLRRAGGCLVAAPNAEGLLEWPLPKPVKGSMVVVSLPEGSTVPPTNVGVDIDSGFGLPPAPQKAIRATGPPETDTNETSVARIRLHVPPGQRLCADGVTVSALTPTRG
jgi:hypothetical protein